jgi:hypothetical protein
LFRREWVRRGGKNTNSQPQSCKSFIVNNTGVYFRNLCCVMVGVYSGARVHKHTIKIHFLLWYKKAPLKMSSF